MDIKTKIVGIATGIVAAIGSASAAPYAGTYATSDLPNIIVDFIGTFVVLMMGENETIVPLLALALIVSLLVGTVMTLVGAGLGLYYAFSKIGGKSGVKSLQ